MGIKNEAQIEQIMYDALKDFLESKTDGQVYKAGCRPLDSNREDGVVGVSATSADQIQEGLAKVNIYTRDINNGSGTWVPDKARIAELSELDAEITERLNEEDATYTWRLSQATRAIKAQEGNQHLVVVYLNFRVTTF